MSFLTLDLNLLRVFDAVMSEQNLTRAAQRLAMTQPAVSNSLRRLRESLNDDLLIRTPHGVKPTARAEELWPAVQSALMGLESAIAPQRFDIAHAKATIWLAMADSTASLLLPSLMRAIQLEAPGINVRIMPLTTRDPRPLLTQNDISIAIGSFPGIVAQLAGGQGAPSSMRHQRLYSGEYVCIMRKGHPLANSDLTLDEYCGAEHALVSFAGRAQGPADEVLAGMGRERRIVLTVNQFYTVGRVVAESNLVSIVPRHVISAIGMDDLLIIKKVPFMLPVVHVDMLWRERDTRNPVHQWLRNTLQVAPNADTSLKHSLVNHQRSIRKTT
jgi:DNA-binding transcriptional LysR family regulator